MLKACPPASRDRRSSAIRRATSGPRLIQRYRSTRSSNRPRNLRVVELPLADHRLQATVKGPLGDLGMDLTAYTLETLQQDGEFLLCRGRAIASPPPHPPSVL